MTLGNVLLFCALSIAAVMGSMTAGSDHVDVASTHDEVVALARRVREQISSRRLQTNSTVGVIGAASPKIICNSFESTGEMSCECERHAKLDVLAQCEMFGLICTPDNSTCLGTSFETIYNALGNSNSWTKTCVTKYADNTTSVSCIQVTPSKVGYFNESVSCTATIDGKTCNSCKQCPDSVPAEIPSTVTADCCNIEKDAFMTCGKVDPGAGLATFVSDPAGTHTDCSAGNSFFHGGLLLTIVTFSSTYMVWSS